KLARNAPAFLFAHLVQAIEGFADLAHHSRFDRLIVDVGGGVERSRYPQNGVQIGIVSEREFSGRGAECRYVSTNDLAIERKGLATGSLDTERDLHMSAGHFVFQQTAKLHLKRIRA